MKPDSKEVILVVDDIPDNIDVMACILSPHFRVKAATNGEEALAIALTRPDLILLDVMMPDMSGHEVCFRLKADPRTCDIPVIFVTAMTDAENEQLGLELGAVDYLHKPSNPAITLQRVRLHMQLRRHHQHLEAMVQERTRELEATRREIVRRLGRAAEYRDNETGMHVLRVGHTARLLSRAAGLPGAQCELLMEAAQMHDIGKIGIPDRILLKPGKLDAEEWTIMKRHPLIGAEILGSDNSELLHMARNVALHHHEKWDGSGYPHGTRGIEIPVEGRIVAIADVFDALITERPYKQPWPLQQAIDYIAAESGKSFDPELAAHFLQLMPQVREIGRNFADSHPSIAK